MDSITHALAAFLVFSPFATGAVLVSAVLGAVLPDSDIVMRRLSDRDPRLFVFSHGGFTHSLAGAAALGAGVALGFLGERTVSGQAPVGPVLVGIVFLASLAGALTHQFLDVLAVPGIPLLYPASCRKVSVGIFPGPRFVLFAASTLFLVVWLMGYGSSDGLHTYAVLGGLFILAHGVLKVAATRKFGKRAIPTVNPLTWLVIRDTGSAWHVSRAGLLSPRGEERIYEKNAGIDPDVLDSCERDPRVRRLRYYSYIVVAERRGDDILLRDPLREDGYIFFPPHYTRVIIPGKGKMNTERENHAFKGY
ncbi:MAG: metal-dependent hydrolase [Methanolinea sp.]|nr:metal-dependent hydrolase [Methanolinea sp.]